MRTITTLSSDVPAASRQCFSAFSDASVEKQMDLARAERAPKPGVHAVVTDAKGGERMNDPNADVIDRIVGSQSTSGDPSEPAEEETQPAAPGKPAKP